MIRGIEAALWGSATRDAEIRVSKAGNEFATISLMVQDGNGADGKPVATFVKILAFGQHVATARTIRRGDRAYAEGTLSASIWTTAAGEPKLDLTVKAHALLKTGIGKNRPPRDDGRRAEAPAQRADPQAPLIMTEPGTAGAFDVERGDPIDL